MNQLTKEVFEHPADNRFSEVATYMSQNMRLGLVLLLVLGGGAVIASVFLMIRLSKEKRTYRDNRWKRFLFPISYFSLLGVAVIGFLVSYHMTGSFYNTTYKGHFAVEDVQPHHNPHKVNLVIDTQQGKQTFVADKSQHVRKGDTLVAEVNTANRNEADDVLLARVSNYDIERLERGGG